MFTIHHKYHPAERLGFHPNKEWKKQKETKYRRRERREKIKMREQKWFRVRKRVEGETERASACKKIDRDERKRLTEKDRKMDRKREREGERKRERDI